ncbi:nSTAND1 domain-containing NTPase [Arthrobacter sp. SAFR-014]|uniref:nSTAND1 domain-containing NTPase n=1 Tax=unclassified Arthrobacter TaxID=235627 RepID=UPI003F7C9B97
MSRVFLSHSSRDTSQAVALKRWLVEQDPGLAEEIFLDLDPVTGIAPGERWKEALLRANERCEAVICLLSANWAASRECLAEYRTAENLGKLILCVRLEPLEENAITGEWQRCDLFGDGPATEIAIDGTGGPVRFLTEGLQRLRLGLHRAGIGAELFPWPPQQDPERAPYRGWEPLEEADAAVFFGRDGQIVRGLDALRTMRGSGVESLFVILGPSGAGKSSFLRAGLLPRLRRDDRQFVVLNAVRPERNPLIGDRGLACSVHALRSGLGLRAPALGEIKDACTEADMERLRVWMTEARHAAAGRLLGVPPGSPLPTLVLPLDQAEELFNADAGPEAAKFLNVFAGLLEHDDGTVPAVIAVGTIRADFYEAMQIAPELAGLKSVVFDELKPMPIARFREVILGPAARATASGRPLEIEPALVDRLLAESGHGADSLPLLALTLARLYRDYGDDGDLMLAEYERMGGMRRVVQNEVDSLLAAARDQRQVQLALLRSAFIPWLATINPDNDQPVRRIARLSDLPEGTRHLIDAMVGKRLLVRDNRGGETLIEVALESLLRQWEDLAGWLAEEREDLKAADALERAAAAWEHSGRNDAWLLEGARLAGAEELAAKPGFRDRLDSVREFLHTSRQRDESRAEAEKQQREAALRAARERQDAAETHAMVLRRRSRVLKAVVAAALAIAVVAVAGFLQASIAQRQANERTREATALRLVSEAQSMVTGGRPGGDVRAIKQILAAHAIAPTAEGANSLVGAVVAEKNLERIMETIDIVDKLAVSPDGRRIVYGSVDGAVHLVDTATGMPVGGPRVGHKDEVRSLAFSPDGRLIASGGPDGKIRRWDGVTGEPAGVPLTAHTDGVTALAFSPDGRMIASGGVYGTLRRWNAKTGEPIGAPIITKGWTISVIAFTPDSRTILSSGDTVRQWDADTGQPIDGWTPRQLGTTPNVAFSPDRRMIVAGGMNGTVRRWDVSTGKAIGGPTGHVGLVRTLAFSPDGRMIASSGDDGTVRRWDAVTGRPIGEPMTGHNGPTSSLTFSPDGRWIIAGGNDGMRWWDAVTDPASAASTIKLEPGSRVAFSSDGRMLASASADGAVRRWDARTGAPIGKPISSNEEFFNDVVFSPDGRMIATSSGVVAADGVNGIVRRWDARTGNQVSGPMVVPKGDVTGLVFSPDSRMLASGSADGAVRRWDADTGDPLGEPMTGHQKSVWSLAFSPDGQTIVSGSDDGTVRRWDAHTGNLIGAPLRLDSKAAGYHAKRGVQPGPQDDRRRWHEWHGTPLGCQHRQSNWRTDRTRRVGEDPCFQP